MHTTQCGITTFIHQGDFSGLVHIKSQDSPEDRPPEIAVPAEDLLEFVGRIFQSHQRSRIDNMSGIEYLREILQ